MAEEKKTTAKRKGKATFIKTSKGLFHVGVLRKEETKRKKSKQLAEVDPQYLLDNNLIPLPFNASAILDLQDNCPYFDASVRQIAKDVVGQGWSLVSKEEATEEGEAEGGTESKKQREEAERKKATAFLERLNDDNESIDAIIEKAIIDWGLMGWICLEVSREDNKPGGEPNGMWHLPAQTIRRHKSKEKYCQVRNDRKRWFARYDLEDSISAIDGTVLKDTKTKDRKEVDVANELIYMLNYYPQSEYYGAPNALSAIGSIYGSIGVRDYNLSFFDNYGVPAALVTLEGEWEENTPKQISDFIDAELKGTENAHKTMVLELPEGGSIKWVPLVTDQKEGSFTVYSKELRDEILSSNRMPLYRIGLVEQGKLGGSTATEATKIYSESIVGPLKKMTADMITQDILEEMGIKLLKFEWGTLDTRSLDTLTERWWKLFGMGAINPNYIRKEMGLKEREDDGGEEYYIAKTFIQDPIGEKVAEDAFGDAIEEVKDEMMRMKREQSEEDIIKKEDVHIDKTTNIEKKRREQMEATISEALEEAKKTRVELGKITGELEKKGILTGQNE